MEGVRTVTLKSNSSFSAAQRRGDHIETHKRWAAGQISKRLLPKARVIADYEQGRALKNQNILSKLERALGVKLRGKDKGKPLGGPKKS
ncbi:unnamed protein product [Heterobilharzia americana]|nr:unnamed protein product [Heterobilharzia americana]